MRPVLLTCCLAAFAAAPLAADEWQPKQAPLMTRWADDVTPENSWSEYPRPQLVRKRWKNLNGLWNYAIQPKEQEKPSEWNGKILVPFCAESALSGVMKPVGEKNKLWYRRTFVIPADWQGQDVLLHFGAVDWRATVWVNGKKVGRHEGGYDPFTFNITDALEKGGENTIVIAVWDPTDKGTQPHGKQVAEPHGIWYTAVTGIWQTVWLEPVPEVYIESMEIVPDLENNAVKVTVDAANAQGAPVTLAVNLGNNADPVNLRAGAFANPVMASGEAGEEITVEIPGDVALWTPEDPNLYTLSVTLGKVGNRDQVDSYFAMRSIAVKEADDGYQRLFLNGEPLFHFGPLDQGWWPDGLYTAPCDEALIYDIKTTKKLGFNTARKHVKVAPARWYYHCDRLGLMVWQDMPSGDRHIRGDDPDIKRTPESEAIYRKEWKAIIEDFDNHPCIVVWVPFNEGWGQFKTNEIIAYTKKLDPNRLVDAPSGWTDRGEGDMVDKHQYPGPGMFPTEEDRASVLGEFGGLGWPVEGHLWRKKESWGYRTYHSQEELFEHYRNLIVQIPALKAKGLAGAIYTQTSDVEIEVNGLMTYDRDVLKFPPEQTRKINSIVYGPPPKTVTLVPTSKEDAQTWRYTTEKPGDDWATAEFDASGWKQGPGPFGTRETPRTEWKSSDIWLRRTVELPKASHMPMLRIYHDEDAEVYLNGTKIADLDGFLGSYHLIPVSDEACQAFQEGKNVLAVHCHQTRGGQYIDVGIVDLVPRAD